MFSVAYMIFFLFKFISLSHTHAHYHGFGKEVKEEEDKISRKLWEKPKHQQGKEEVVEEEEESPSARHQSMPVCQRSTARQTHT